MLFRRVKNCFAAEITSAPESVVSTSWSVRARCEFSGAVICVIYRRLKGTDKRLIPGPLCEPTQISIECRSAEIGPERAHRARASVPRQAAPLETAEFHRH